MNLKIRKASPQTPLKPSGKGENGVAQEKRKKAKVVIIDYDSDWFLVAIKSGVAYVKKEFVHKKIGRRTISSKAVEKEIKKRILAGEYDKEVLRKRRGKKPGPKPKKNTTVIKTGRKRGRPKKASS